MADDSRSIRTVRVLARLLDDAIPIPGTRMRIGLDPLIGLVPGLGDIAGGIASAYIVLAAARLGAPKAMLLRMAANVGIDTIVGSVPIIGDLFDAGWKSNSRNVRLLEAHVADPRGSRATSRLFVAAILLVLLILIVGTAALVWSLVRLAIKS
jgi:hypothetical protein